MKNLKNVANFYRINKFNNNLNYNKYEKSFKALFLEKKNHSTKKIFNKII